MSKVMRTAIKNGLDSDETVFHALNHKKTSWALTRQLEKRNIPDADIARVFNDICTFYMDRLGAEQIVRSTPELCILEESQQN